MKFYRNNSQYPNTTTSNEFQDGRGRPMLKFTFLAQTGPLLHILAPNLKQVTKMCPRARFIVKIHFFQNRTWLLPPFCNQSNGDKSANIEQIGTKFDTVTDSRVMEHVLASNFLSDKIHYGGGRQIEIRIYRHHLATFQEILHIVKMTDKKTAKIKNISTNSKH